MTDTPTSSAAHETCRSPADYSFDTQLVGLSSLQGIDFTHLQPLSAEIHRWRTKEGTQAHLVPIHDRPVFDLVLRFKAGSAADGDTHGLAALALYTLDQGTGDLDAARFADRLEGLGAILDRKISQDCAIVSLRGLSTPALRDGAMQLVTAMVAKPAFRDADIGKIRERLVNYHRSNSRSARAAVRGDCAPSVQRASLRNLACRHTRGPCRYNTGTSGRFPSQGLFSPKPRNRIGRRPVA